MSTKSAHVIGSYRIDRYFLDDQGTRWVVDYKISPREGSERESFWDQQRKRYRAQLERYRDALGGATLGLYFPLLAGWRSWPYGPGKR